MNYLPKYSRDHADHEWEVDQEGAEFIGNKQTNLLTHKHAYTQLFH